jgi:hypothetical protein
VGIEAEGVDVKPAVELEDSGVDRAEDDCDVEEAVGSVKDWEAEVVVEVTEAEVVVVRAESLVVMRAESLVEWSKLVMVLPLLSTSISWTTATVVTTSTTVLA